MIEDFREDLRTFSALGCGLWTDPRVSKRSAVETLSATVLLSRDPGQRIEKAAAALLESAKVSEGRVHQEATLDFISAPFYRLNLEDRFILICLHIGHWSYSRLARILKVTRDEVEEKAWAARLKMAAGNSTLSYPAGPARPEPHCPVYHSTRPWTQRLLDDGITSRLEKVNLEQHLPTCASCAQALKRSREFYFELDRKVSETAGKRNFADALERVLREGEFLTQSPYPLVIRSFIVWMNRKDVQGLVLFWVLMFVIQFYFKL